MNQKSIVGLVIISLVIVFATQSASASPCNHWCQQEKSAKVAYVQLQQQHGFSYGHLYANYGWGFHIGSLP